MSLFVCVALRGHWELNYMSVIALFLHYEPAPVYFAED